MFGLFFLLPYNSEDDLQYSYSDLGLCFFFKVKISANLRGSRVRLRESSRTAFSENTEEKKFFF